MFEVPQSKRSIKQNRFEFTVDGATYDIPLLKYLPVAAAEALEEGKQIRAFMLACDTDAVRDVIRSFDADQLLAFSEAWETSSGVNLGESQASTDS